MKGLITHLSLFSGIGGLDLAAEWAGFTTVGQCEWADFPAKVLEKHWPDVPKWRDIHNLTGEDFCARTGLRTVDVISGGFPCQPFSVAGKQKGKEDERYLFPEMLRIISDLKPRFVVGENVPGILRIAASDIVEMLEREGYECVLFDFEAAAVGAKHRRERIAFVAHTGGQGLQWRKQHGTHREGPDSRRPSTLGAASERSYVLFNAKRKGLAECHGQRMGQSEEHQKFESTDSEDVRGWGKRCGTKWPDEPNVGRVANGVPNRVDRIKALGNAVVPQQFYPIFLAIADELKREADE